ncbi:DUF7619 domain-containing protein [Halocola ammonii]
MFLLRTFSLFAAILFTATAGYCQYEIDPAFLFEATDIDGNTHNVQEYLDNGTPVILFHFYQYENQNGEISQNSWELHEEANLPALYSSNGMGGTGDVVILYVATYGFPDEQSLSGLDYSEDYGPGYEDLSYTENNPIPIILASDNDEINEYFIEWGPFLILCPENEMWGAGPETDFMQSIYSNCCTDLETFDPALPEGSYNSSPNCDPTEFEYTIANESTTPINSLDIDVYVNGNFSEQITITETLEGCTSQNFIYESDNLQGGEEITLAIANDNDQLYNDTISLSTQEVDTIGTHIMGELVDVQGQQYYMSLHLFPSYESAWIGQQNDWQNHLFVQEPGCYRLEMENFWEDEQVTVENGTYLVGSLDENQVMTDTIFSGEIIDPYYLALEKTVFIEGDPAEPFIWGYVFEDTTYQQFFDPDFNRIAGVQVDYGNMTTFTDNDGYYEFEDYVLFQDVTITYNESDWPVYTNPNAGEWEQNTFFYNFGLNSDDPVWDLQPFWNSGIPFLCETDFQQAIPIENVGNQPTTGELIFTHDPALTVENTSPPFTSQNGNTLTFDISEIQLGGWTTVWIEYEDATADLLGTEVSTDWELNTFDDQGNVVNTVTQSQTDSLFCSYDPNDIYGFPLGAGQEGLIADSTQELKYRIRFQNTGNYPATTVVVKNTIPEELNLSSFNPGSSSHEYSVTINQETREATWTFDNIMLPDSASNPEGSIGTLWYEINLVEDLPWWTTIENSAEIYFDQNDAIYTNTSIHTIEGEVSVHENGPLANFEIFPNPANDELFLSGNIPVGEVLEIRDMQGRLVKEFLWKNENESLSVSDLPAGAYIVNLRGFSGQKKLLIAR